MGRKNIRNLSELKQHQKNLRVECACGRVSIFGWWQLTSWADAHRWPFGLDAVAGRMRCAACGGKPKHWGITGDNFNVDLQELAAARRDAALDRARFYAALAGEPLPPPTRPTSSEAPPLRLVRNAA